MKLHVWGTDFRRSTPEMRQKLYVPPQEREARLREWLALGFEDVVYLHTCNRVEFYTTGKDFYSDSRPLWMKLLKSLGLTEEDYYHGYQLEGKTALRHLLRVSCSLESLVVGEPQILGQLKEAVQVTKGAGLPFSASLERCFRLAFETAKRVRTATAIGEKPVSVATLGLQHLVAMEKEVPLTQAVVVGRSPICVNTVQWLLKHRPGVPILWVNRNAAALEEIPESKHTRIMPLSDFMERPPAFSHLFTATASTQPVFDRRFFARLARLSHQPSAATGEPGKKPLVFDFAQPPDVERCEEAFRAATVLYLDGLMAEAKRNAESRSQAVGEAETMIELAIRDYCLQSKEAPLLRDYNEVEPRFMEELASALELIEAEFPVELQPKLKKWAEKLVKKNLHNSREHLRAVLRNIANGQGGGHMPVM